MPADETIILNLFDSYWFEYGVFTAKTPLVPSPVDDLDHQVQDQGVICEPKLQRITTLMRKSHSDQFLSSKLDHHYTSSGGNGDNDNNSSPSPTSVLGPQLQTILSGKEMSESTSQDSLECEIITNSTHTKNADNINPCVSLSHTVKRKPERNRQTRTRTRKSTGSRSLSDLEFEELKGFMDLGFVFSDEDKNSTLVSIIPGLQRLGKSDDVQDSDKAACSSSEVSRPYLSEAWDCLEDDDDVKINKNVNSLTDWRIPVFGNELELKHHLRSWAHTVASTVN